MHVLILVIALWLCLPSWSLAQVALTDSNEGFAAPGESLTISLTPTGTNAAVYGCIVHEPGSNDVDTVTATYNGNAMNILLTDVSSHGSRHLRAFSLPIGTPDGSPHNVVFSWGGANRQFAAIVASFSGVDQSDPDDAHVVGDGSAGVTSISETVTSAVNDMVMDCTVISQSAAITNFAVNQGNTQIQQFLGNGVYNGLGASYEAGAASVTIGWSWDQTIAAMGWAWNINAAAAGGGSPRNLMLMGVGQ